MRSKVKKLWWPLRSKARFVFVHTIWFATLGLVIVVAVQLNHTGFARSLESLFGLFGGALGGLLWSLMMWELMLKDRVQRILAKEAEANRAEA